MIKENYTKSDVDINAFVDFTSMCPCCRGTGKMKRSLIVECDMQKGLSQIECPVCHGKGYLCKRR